MIVSMHFVSKKKKKVSMHFTLQPIMYFIREQMKHVKRECHFIRDDIQAGLLKQNMFI